MAAVRTGLSALSSKAGNVAGNISGRVARVSDAATGVVGKTVAPASNRVLKAIDRPMTVAANLAPALATAAVYAQVKVATTGPGQGRRPGAAVATSGMRLMVRGQPQAKYRGVIIRKSPLTPRKAKILNRVTGGRVLASEGYYFHEGGRTWHCQSFTVDVKGTPRTLTHIRSLSLPHREHFFDRPLTLNENGETQIGDDATARSVAVQRVIDVVMGNEEPDRIPGYIGSTNEFENAGGLGGIKRAFFAANWFLVDESERDIPSGPDFVDYDALVQGRPPGSQDGGFYRVARPGGGGSGGSSGSGPTSGWPSTRRTSPVRPAASTSGNPRAIPGLKPRPTSSEPAPYGANLFRSTPQRPPPPPAADDPYVAIKDRYRHPNGKQYPLVVRRVVTNPVTQTKKADAVYYDGDMKMWREIVDDDTREALAREVEAGKLKVMDDW